ncbi:MAG: nucleotidyltransferase family protein [Bacteroidales bacterium]|nr:nucleotidyltransferase family protein [Bacteroidales bacterium]
MKRNDRNIVAFLALLRSGLWEQGVRLKQFEQIDFSVIYDLAEEQSVVGLVAAGLEHIEDGKRAKQEVLPFMKKVIAIENRNSAMNDFIGMMIDKMREQKIYALLVKGQGIAQCYERPQWRSSGDVDFLLDSSNYERAKDFMFPLANAVEVEDIGKKHIGMTIESWSVELHGTLRNGLTRRANRVIDRVQYDMFCNGDVQMWRNGNTDIPMPGTDSNVVFIFSHILQHFFHGGIGLRQLCDWSRLLWNSRTKIDKELLKSRLQKMRLMTEWKSFGAFAVKYLGLATDAMPFYDCSRYYKRKSDKILSIILEKGNFGQNVDNSYMANATPLKRKFITIWRQLKESMTFFRLFPLDTLRFLGFFFVDGFERTKTTTTFSEYHNT